MSTKSVDLMIVSMLMNVHFSSPCFSLVNFLYFFTNNAYEVTICIYFCYMKIKTCSMIVNESTFRQTLQCAGVSILYLDNRKAY